MPLVTCVRWAGGITGGEVFRSTRNILLGIVLLDQELSNKSFVLLRNSVSVILETSKMQMFSTLLGLATLSCISTASATATNTLAKPAFTYDQLWNFQIAFWDSFLYPENVKQVKGNESTVFTPEVGFFHREFRCKALS